MHTNPELNLVITGHVDHGKSTLMGRLLADSNSLPEGKLEQVRALCEKNARPFEYAYLLDALKEEQAKGITIDGTRICFKTEKRTYNTIDAPGHVEFLKNMVSGAAHADAAIHMIDIGQGIQENTRRHANLLHFLGVKQVIVVVNKMDLVGYDEKKFLSVQKEFGSFLKNIGIEPLAYIPAAASLGENLVESSAKMPWYKGESLLRSLDLLLGAPSLETKAFRFFVQDIYSFTANKKILAGTVSAGTLRPQDEIFFYPSKQKARVAEIQGRSSLGAGIAGGFTLQESLLLQRGELVGKAGEEQPLVAQKFTASLFWLGQKKMEQKKKYILRLGTARTELRLIGVQKQIHSDSLAAYDSLDFVAQYATALVELETQNPIAFDLDLCSRFVVVDEYDIAGGGFILSV